MTSIDPKNDDFALALRYLSFTDTHLFINGKAGCGKTFFIQHLSNYCPKKILTLAPTGVAAHKAGGSTVHSFFKLPLNPTPLGDVRFLTPYQQRLHDIESELNIFNFLCYSKEKINVIKNLDVLVIDEVSMLRPDTLDTIDQIMRVYHEQPKKEFGGKQVVLVGDPFQLPPVIKGSEAKNLLNQDYHTIKPYFFDSAIFNHLWNEGSLKTIEFKTTYRQRSKPFIAILDQIREGTFGPEVITELNQRHVRPMKRSKNTIIELTTHRDLANQTNLEALEEIPGDAKEYVAEIEGNLNPKDFPFETHLNLKVGAQVVCLKNLTSSVFNGSLGTVHQLSEDSIEIEFENQTLTVVPQEWEERVHQWNPQSNQLETEVTGIAYQFPLTLGWAITIHKSQGLSFQRAIINIENTFVDGHVYVALSRLTSLEGLFLRSPVDPWRVKVSEPCVNFMKRTRKENHNAQALKEARCISLLRSCWESIKIGELDDAVDYYNQTNDLCKPEELVGSEIIERCMNIYDYKENKIMQIINSKNLGKPIIMEGPEEVDKSKDNLPSLILDMLDLQVEYSGLNLGEIVVEIFEGKDLNRIQEYYGFNDEVIDLLKKVACSI